MIVLRNALACPLKKAVNIRICRGLTAILGESGSGKSTLFRMILGLQKLVHGEILFRAPLTITNIAFLPQNGFLLPDLSVMSNLLYAAKLSQQDKPAIYSLLKLFKVSHIANSKMSKISGGENKIVHLIHELLWNPSSIFLDEPFSGLDPIKSVFILEKLELLSRNRFILFSSHSLSDFLHADKIIVVADLQVIFYGTLQELLDHFQTSQLSQTYYRLQETTADHWFNYYRDSPLFQKYCCWGGLL